MTAFNIFVETIDEAVDEAKRLGRHIEHDARSLWYLFDHDQVTTPIAPVLHDVHLPVLDQGNLGSCTGNAALENCAADPAYAALPNGILSDSADADEHLAVEIYSEGSHLDNVPGNYPPDDTGSTGLAVAKAVAKRGYVAGYQHVTGGISALQKTIQVTPFLLGINWYDSMDTPDANGVVSISRDAVVRGGHELTGLGYDPATDLWEILNHWSPDWGVNGRCKMSSATLARLLGERGDVTVLVPKSAPTPTPAPPTPPQPTPTPNPGPTPDPDTLDRQFWTYAQNWARAKGIL